DSLLRLQTRWKELVILLCACLTVVTRAKTVKYQTFEEDAPGTVIGNLAKDMSASGSRNSFRMMKQFNSSLIRLRESDGQLSIAERIDRERLCKHSQLCLISFDVVSFSKEQFKLVHVEVEVKDINDNSPEFPRKESSLEISENTAVGTRIPLDFAVDPDVGSNYIQSYQISVNSHFSIDLVLMKELDRETQATYALELVAVDGGTPSRTGTTRINLKVKDYNDNSPVFDRSSFSVELAEDAPLGTMLLDLNAEDPDEGLNGEVVYGFGNQVPQEIRQLFRVDRKTGRLTLESPVDFETKNTYEFDVQATDLGPNPSPAICKIVIQVQDVNDNAPRFRSAAARESFVALVSTSDRDSGANGQVHCTLYGHEHFRLQQAYEDSFMIVSTSALDREKIPEYNLTIVAEDLGSPPFRTITHYTIRLTDENDNAPVFTKALYDVAVTENNAPGAYVTTVVARDQDLGSNGKVTYKLADTYFMGSPISTFVSLDPASGSLYALRSFNFELVKQLELRVIASDGGSPPLAGSASVYIRIVDQNDNTPVITQPPLHNGSAEIPLPREAPSGYIVTRVEARDADEGINAELSFALASSDSSAFSVNKATGDVYLSHALSHDVDETLRVTVTVSDNGRPALSSTATLHFLVVAGAPPSDHSMYESENGSPLNVQWDLSVVIIVVLAGSCTLLLLAIILIATTCNRRKRDKTEEDNESYHEKEAVRPITIWKGNSYTTISARDPVFSGKDSGKGDSDFNDSDSDVSADTLKKEGVVVPPMALWACTSECKVLGHSDRCWSPTAVRAHAGTSPSPAPTLSSFSSLPKTASLPRDPNRRDNYYQAQLPKTVGLQSVYEKVLHREYDYMLVTPPRPVRCKRSVKSASQCTPLPPHTAPTTMMSKGLTLTLHLL
uniref:Protocadherin-8 n=1 Tax=Neogobius melanostomus TaxID=47308 RepID=A0A8C6SDD9_9GOBI